VSVDRHFARGFVARRRGVRGAVVEDKKPILSLAEGRPGLIGPPTKIERRLARLLLEPGSSSVDAGRERRNHTKIALLIGGFIGPGKEGPPRW